MPGAYNIMKVVEGAAPPHATALRSYFRAACEPLLRELARRPLTLVRHSGGLVYFHKGPLPRAPDAVHLAQVPKGDGSGGVRAWVDDLAGLLGLVEMGVVELHPWNCTVDDVEHADRLVFDLDPDPDAGWAAVTRAALALREFLRDFRTWPKTTGGKGLHVVVPLARALPWDEVRVLARRLAETFAATDRETLTALPGASARRGGRIFIDYLRNGRGASAIGAWSPRALAGGRVAMPLTWAQLARGVKPETFTLAATARKLSRSKAGFPPSRE